MWPLNLVAISRRVNRYVLAWALRDRLASRGKPEEAGPRRTVENGPAADNVSYSLCLLKYATSDAIESTYQWVVMELSLATERGTGGIPMRAIDSQP